MADIDVQRKGPAIWPWILGLILLALLIWLLASQWGRDDQVAVAPVTEEPATPAATEPGVGPAALQQFQQQCVAVDAARQAGLEHQFTIDCLRQLADAIEATAQQQGLALTAVQPQTQEVRQHAQDIEQLPAESPEHSNHARLGAMAAVAAMQTVNQAPGTPDAGGQVNQAEQAAQSLVPGQTLLDQTNDLNRFFQQAHSALQSLSRGTAQT